MAPTNVIVELDLSPGVLVLPQVLPALDPSGDRRITDAEGQAYVKAVLSNLTLRVDGQPAALTVTKIDMPPYLNIQAGYGTIRVFTSAALASGMTGSHQISFANAYAFTGSAYQVNAFVDAGVAVTLGAQNRSANQQRMTMDYAIDGSMSTATGSAAAVKTPAGAIGQARRLLVYLDAPNLSAWKLALALALAVMLGALHALTPGHGKTLVAAYLVGSRGTVRRAAALGAIVTITHTASVMVIGLLAQFASQFIVPGVLVPTLDILSGVLVVAMGVRLIRQRWFALRDRGDSDHARTHDHDHDHDLAHAHSHDHGDGRGHSHLPPAEGLTPGSLLAMGASGGLIPCPEALGIMIIAVGLNRILLGLGRIVSFSVGLAAVLIAIGILLVRSRSLVERFGGLSSRWSSALPLGSAMIVTALGVGIAFGGLSSYLR